MSPDRDSPENEAKGETPIDAAPETNPDSGFASSEASTAAASTAGDTNMAMLCHLLSFVGFLGIPLGNIIGPLIIWLVKKDQDPFVDATGKEVLNFQISASIYGIICGLLIFIFVGIILLPILIIGVVIYTIIGAIKASEGQLYRYPLTIRFLK